MQNPYRRRRRKIWQLPSLTTPPRPCPPKLTDGAAMKAARDSDGERGAGESPRPSHDADLARKGSRGGG
ncbi:hypothetical protein TIFTF001_029491 [Ficus carica]|uniref:Uncharacterized protein n=1 Tax=Ficus carica TaxID=3494 RepID=A0AA88DRX7_FICCA|nr:hypothetical protein TIFTF001_029491 [Ficus carica]